MSSTAPTPWYCETAATPIARARTIVLDTDLGHDPDDAINLIAAARTITDLTVFTCDEVFGDLRARMGKAMLGALGRDDVQVVAGVDLGASRMAMDYETVAGWPQVSTPPLVEVVRELCERSSEPLLWVGCGPLSSLAQVRNLAPDLLDHIQLVQMGGWLDGSRYRNSTRASHNLRVDIPAARAVLGTIASPRLVLSEHTGVPAIRVTPRWPLYQRLTAPDAPDWARIAGTNFAIWCRSRDGSWMHDPLTLAEALGKRFVPFEHAAIRIDEHGLLHRDQENGQPMLVSTDPIDYHPFLDWLDVVTATGPTTPDERHDG
ncbi:nucleoside hydrolase [Nocardia sp. NPDC004068]|uniref:nucleoside hydrolase n=1 Tax=Nocardia sp. NPDC004068 TaxID=3364303 RepID=UPI0036CD9B22